MLVFFGYMQTLALRHPLQPDDSLFFLPTINACLTFSCSPCCLFGRSLFCLPTAFLEHTEYYKAKTSHIEQAKEKHEKSEKKRTKKIFLVIRRLHPTSLDSSPAHYGALRFLSMFLHPLLSSLVIWGAHLSSLHSSVGCERTEKPFMALETLYDSFIVFALSSFSLVGMEDCSTSVNQLPSTFGNINFSPREWLNPPPLLAHVIFPWNRRQPPLNAMNHAMDDEWCRWKKKKKGTRRVSRKFFEGMHEQVESRAQKRRKISFRVSN